MVAAYRVIVEGLSRDAAIAEIGRYQGIWFKADPHTSAACRANAASDPPQSGRVDAETEARFRIICEKGSVGFQRAKVFSVLHQRCSRESANENNGETSECCCAAWLILTGLIPLLSLSFRDWAW